MKQVKKTAKKLTVAKAKKLVQNQNRRTRQSNARFEALSHAEKRVAIARDVLAQIATKRLVPANRIWLAGKDNSNLFSKKDLEKNPEFQKILSTKKECTGCALGGLFMCAVEVADKLKLSELRKVKDYQEEMLDPTNDDKRYTRMDGFIQGDDAFKYLRRFFSQEQLDAIESAFERGVGASTDMEAAGFAPDEYKPAERMKLIMQNIILHKGKFVPEDQPILCYSYPNFDR
jgi:hypothetical protein